MYIAQRAKVLSAASTMLAFVLKPHRCAIWRKNIGCWSRKTTWIAPKPMRSIGHQLASTGTRLLEEILYGMDDTVLAGSIGIAPAAERL
jgi:hypothetical protein